MIVSRALSLAYKLLEVVLEKVLEHLLALLLVVADPHLKVFESLQNVAPAVAAVLHLEPVQGVRVAIEDGRPLQQHCIDFGEVVGAGMVELEADDPEKFTKFPFQKPNSIKNTNHRLLGWKFDSLNRRRESAGMPFGSGRWARPQAHPLLGVFHIRPDIDHRSWVVRLVDGDGMGYDVLFEFDNDEVLHGHLRHILGHNLVSCTRRTLPPAAVRALQGE